MKNHDVNSKKSGARILGYVFVALNIALLCTSINALKIKLFLTEITSNVGIMQTILYMIILASWIAILFYLLVHLSANHKGWKLSFTMTTIGLLIVITGNMLVSYFRIGVVRSMETDIQIFLFMMFGYFIISLSMVGIIHRTEKLINETKNQNNKVAMIISIGAIIIALIQCLI